MALQLEEGFGRAKQLLEHSHLSSGTGTEGKEDSWHLRAEEQPLELQPQQEQHQAKMPRLLEM